MAEIDRNAVFLQSGSKTFAHASGSYTFFKEKHIFRIFGKHDGFITDWFDLVQFNEKRILQLFIGAVAFAEFPAVSNDTIFGMNISEHGGVLLIICIILRHTSRFSARISYGNRAGITINAFYKHQCHFLKIRRCIDR